jgi:mannosylglycerate hydrolase
LTLARPLPIQLTSIGIVIACGQMKCFLVTHSHWDREWYRTFQAFRARLVDMIDTVLDQTSRDAGFRFLLDGQTIVLEDYLEIRPQRRDELRRACESGRIAIGPWYVQPDSLLPSGEAHVRNLLEGRRVGRSLGPVSRTAYTPDSFGHPAQFPQLFRGFGLGPFVYWRGNGDEIDLLPAEYLWKSPDGSMVLVHHLWKGYFAAAGMPKEADAAVPRLRKLGEQLLERTRNDCVLLMNGIDHAMPCKNAQAIAEALASATGWTVQRALLDDFARELSGDAPAFEGELLGGRIANLLPGVWSARTPLKLRNRRAEALLEAWAEPWAALGRVAGAPDERPALRSAWRSLLQNQAHDSICGCSQDRVHEQMLARYDVAEELGAETTTRMLERIAGMDTERETPWSDEIDVAVFNPSPFPRTDAVCFALDPRSWIEIRGDEVDVHPLLRATLSASGYTADGRPARLLLDNQTDRVRLFPERPALSVELVVSDVPAFGWKRVRLRPSATHADEEDAGSEISVEDLTLGVADDGTFQLRAAGRTYAGLCGLEDIGDRGDTYDFDPVCGGTVRLDAVEVRRRKHPHGIQSLTVRRILFVPAELGAKRDERSDRLVGLVVDTEARLVPGTNRVDLCVRVDNQARDHRLRLLFPSGTPVGAFFASTTFDVARRTTQVPEASRWVHPGQTTFPQQGFVSANGLTVAAPGLPEAEMKPDGVIAVTLLRSVGWLARMDLRTRPQPAGPALPTPGAQCLQTIEARLWVFAGLDASAVRAAEVGFRAVLAGPAPLLVPDQPLLQLRPREVLLSALKPAEEGEGMILRLLNPTDDEQTAEVQFGFPVSTGTSLRLDESPDGQTIELRDDVLRLRLRPHELRTVLLGRK